MFITNKSHNLKKLYIFFFVTVLLINLLSTSRLYGNSFNITEIQVSEDFNLNFNKKKVFDSAFKIAFDQLTSSIIISEDKKKLKKVSLKKIKSLIDSFIVSDEQFIENKYYAKINVNFNKKNSYKFFESKNIFPSMPNRIDILMIPILIKNTENEIIFFSENPLYKNWNKNKKKYHLINYILPSEDIEDRMLFKKNIENIEEYNFNEIIQKYDLANYVILIINENNNKLNILSKLQFKGDFKIFSNSYEDFNLDQDFEIIRLIDELKNIYDDEWKKLNLINTSIKLPITLSLSSKDYNKVNLFEKTLNNLDLVSHFSVLSFDNKKILYRVTFNGSPDKFFKQINNSGFFINKQNQILKIE